MRRDSGFTIIELLIVVAVIAIVAALAVPVLVKARRSAREAAAIGSLRTILSAQSAYLPTLGAYSSYGNSTQLTDNKYVDPELFNGIRNGYSFSLTVDAGGKTFEAEATPDPADADSRYFWTSEQAVIRYNEGAAAGPTSPRIPEFQ